jgi:general secretion pathway protein I
VSRGRHTRLSAMGQTLVEVLVAMVVLGVGLVSVLEAFSVCSLAVGVMKSEAVARGWAAEKMGELRTNPALLTSDESGDLGKEYPGFTWRRQVRETPEHGVLSVSVEVKWKNRGVERGYSLVTLIRTHQV